MFVPGHSQDNVSRRLSESDSSGKEVHRIVRSAGLFLSGDRADNKVLVVQPSERQVTLVRFMQGAICRGLLSAKLLGLLCLYRK